MLPWVYSELWSESSPFLTTVATQKSRGANVLAHMYMDALWSEGIAGTNPPTAIPIYSAQSNDPLLTAVCTGYNKRCNVAGVRIHVPAYAVAQQASDAHITIVDQNAPAGEIEMDCWKASVSGSKLDCFWGGVYALGSTGTATDGSEAIHAGMAVSTVFLTGTEATNGHIDHALGMDTSCLNNPAVYPADSTNSTDRSCNGSLAPPHFGDLMHLLWTPAQIAQSAYSAPCKVVLTALATYGAYLTDTGNDGLMLDVHNELSYTANPATKSSDPWPKIQTELDAAGDGPETPNATYPYWFSCLNRLSASDFELLEIKK